jgi:hypothetical protein
VVDDLRHEVTHGYLHAVVKNMPQWLDEGIAKYYEVYRGQKGINRPLLDRMIVKIERDRWQPDLSRLEQFPPTYNMTQDDYAEAWAWTHFLMDARPETLDMLRAYLTDMRRDGVATPLSVRLATIYPQAPAALIDYLRRLDSGK